MNFVAFLILMLVFMVIVVVTIGLMYKNEHIEVKSLKAHIHYWNFALLAVALILGYWTFSNYTHSGSNKYYSNTDYSLIEYDGFQFPKGREVALTSDGDAQSAAWEDGEGDLSISVASNSSDVKLKYGHYGMPIRVGEEEKSKLGTWGKFQSSKWINVPEGCKLNSGDAIRFADSAGNTKISLRYIEEKGRFSKVNAYKFIVNIGGGETDTITLDKLSTGISVLDLLNKSMIIPIGKQEEQLFSHSYLLREHSLKGNKSAPLLFFPSMGLKGLTSVCTINGSPVSINLPEQASCSVAGKLFEVGFVDGNKRYRVSMDSNIVKVEKVIPLRFHFPKDLPEGHSKFVLTTSMDEIINYQDDYDYFYRFNIPSNDSIPFKTTAVLELTKGTANTSLDLSFWQFNAHENNCKSHIKPNESFILPSMQATNNGGNGVAYILKIVDNQKNIVYTHTIWLFVSMMLLIALIYVFLYKKFVVYNENAARKRACMTMLIETAIYLILISFLTVRLVLQWRIIAFQPIENMSVIDMEIFNTPRFFVHTFISVIALLVVRLLLLLPFTTKIKDNFSSKIKSITESKFYCDFTSKTWITSALILTLYGVWALIAFVLRTKAFIKIVIPICAFVLVSVWIYNKFFYIESRKRWLWPIVANVIGLGIVWFVAEKGMLLPFCVFLATATMVLSFFLTNITNITNITKKILKALPLFFGILLCSLVIIFVLCPSIVIPDKWISENPRRIGARMLSMKYSPDEMFANAQIGFDDEAARNIRNASSNYWFIENNIRHRAEMGKHATFVPESDYTDQAVSYQTQTRDLLPLRFMILEHGRFPLVLLISILFVAVVGICLAFKNNFRVLFGPMLVLLFLLAVATYIYFVNCNMVVFVGQDFPFLTPSSSFVPYFFVILLGLTILLLNLKNGNEMKGGSTGIKTSLSWKSLYAILGTILSVFILVLVLFPQTIKNAARGEVKEEYGISVAAVSDFISKCLNDDYASYQEENPISNDCSIFDTAVQPHVNKYLTDNLDRLLKNYAEFYSGANDTTFIKSVFEKFKQGRPTNDNFIVYLKKSQRKERNILYFVTNSSYYKIRPIFPKPDAEAWSGDLLAAETIDELSIMDDSGVKVSMRASDRLMNVARGGTGTIVRRALPSSELYYIPAKYCYSKKSVIILQPKESVSVRFAKAEKISTVNHTIRLELNDVVIGPKNHSLGFIDASNRYLAKNIQYNGKSQSVYPLGNKFMYAYVLDNMLKSNFIAQDSASRKAVRVGLDYALFEQVYRYISRNCARALDGVTVMAVDGNGVVRLMADWEANKATKVDPNDSRKIQQLLRELDIEGDRSTQYSMLANRNTRILSGNGRGGPGSTIKPVYFSAIASQLHIDWEQFRLYTINNERLWKSGDTGDTVKVFANYPVRWASMSPEYLQAAHGMGVVDFIKHSNNYYFGTMMMLGMYPSCRFTELRDAIIVGSSEGEVCFPKIRFGDEYCKFRDGFMNEMFANSNFSESPMGKGLTKLFDFEILQQNLTRDEKKVGRDYDLSLVESFDINTFKSIYSEFAYSPRPKYHFKKYYLDNGEINTSEMFKIHFNSVCGGDPLEISPMKMAEAYLRIATLSKVPLTLDDRQKARVQDPISFDSYSLLMNGMWEVISSGTMCGGHFAEYQNELRSRGIYMYGKTGTTNSAGSGRNDVFAAIILSNRDLRTEQADKIYVIYMGFYKGPGTGFWAGVRRSIIESVINSETFKKYWYE